MLSGEFLEKAGELVARVLASEKPFGGLQVVFCGDFLQLPPVKADSMAFQSSVWGALGLRHIVLKHNFRQSRDPEFQSLLGELRLGVLEKSKLAASFDTEGGSKVHPKIVSTNDEALKINTRNLGVLPDKARTYEARDEADNPRDPGVVNAFASLLAEKTLELKVGCVVMLLKNLRLPTDCKPVVFTTPRRGGKRPSDLDIDYDTSFMDLPSEYQGLQTPLVNGSIGMVVGFEHAEDGVEYPLVADSPQTGLGSHGAQDAGLDVADGRSGPVEGLRDCAGVRGTLQVPDARRGEDLRHAEADPQPIAAACASAGVPCVPGALGERLRSSGCPASCNPGDRKPTQIEGQGRSVDRQDQGVRGFAISRFRLPSSPRKSQQTRKGSSVFHMGSGNSSVVDGELMGQRRSIGNPARGSPRRYEG